MPTDVVGMSGQRSLAMGRLARTPVLRSLVAERPRPRWLARWPHAWLLAVGTVCFGAFMGQLDASIVTLTFHPLQQQFHAGLAGVQWVSLSYMLTLVALLAPIGRLSDAHGRKLLYLNGFAVFTVASAACALAPSLVALILFRVVQAVGAAMMQSNSVALVATSAPRARMRVALGVQATGQALGLALGPTVGGVLVSSVGWRWVFMVNVPVGIVALIGGRYLLPRTRERHPIASFDWSGLLYLAVGCVALLIAVSGGSGLPIGLPAVVTLGVVAVAAMVGLVRRELRARSPLVDMRMMRDRSLAMGLLGALSSYLVLFGPLVMIPIVLTTGGASAVHAGLVLTALPAGFAVAALLGERLLPATWSNRRRAALGSASCVAATAVFAAVPTSTVPLVLVLLWLGLGLGVFTPANNATVMGAVPKHAAGTAGGLINMTRGLGTALGVALVTLALHTGSSQGPRTAVLILLGVSVLTAITVAMSRRGLADQSGDRDAHLDLG